MHPPEPSRQRIVHSKGLTQSDFIASDEETASQHEFQNEINVFVAHRVALHNSGLKYPFLSLQDYYALLRPTHTEQSQVIYLEVLDAVADCKDTMIGLLQSLKSTFIEQRGMKWLVLEGDAKLYEILKSLSFEYGEELDWLIPYPGDFHLLMNFQKALMKPYYDAGLKSMAQSAGYPLPAIQSCSQFKRTHNFIMEAWEAIYRAMILEYEAVHPETHHLDTQHILALAEGNDYLSTTSSIL